MCDWTSSRIDEVGMIGGRNWGPRRTADNYVLAPRSNASYSVRIIDIRVPENTGDRPSPWDFGFLPNGSIVISHKDGLITLYTGDRTVALSSLNVSVKNEIGLMGIAVSPHFHRNKHIYAMYSTENSSGYASRIVRFELRNRTLVADKVVIRGIPAAAHHGGGRIEFGPDKNLYVAVGDALKPRLVQDTTRLHGKILRINPNGSIPSSNPFNNSIYSLGHRNPQGLAWHPETGILYESEHGGWRHDEVNRVRKGGNYGWPRKTCENYRSNPPQEENAYTDPVFCPKEWTLAPAGMAFVNNESSPWYSDLFVAGLRSRHLHRLVFRDGSYVRDEIFYIPQISKGKSSHQSRRVRAVSYENGKIWLLFDSYPEIAVLTPRRR